MVKPNPFTIMLHSERDMQVSDRPSQDRSDQQYKLSINQRYGHFNKIVPLFVENFAESENEFKIRLMMLNYFELRY